MYTACAVRTVVMRRRRAFRLETISVLWAAVRVVDPFRTLFVYFLLNLRLFKHVNSGHNKVKTHALLLLNIQQLDDHR